MTKNCGYPESVGLESGHRNGYGYGIGVFANGYGYKDGTGHGLHYVQNYDLGIGYGEGDEYADFLLNHGYGFGIPSGSGGESTKDKCCGHGDYT
jgi:hypothetical protein